MKRSAGPAADERAVRIPVDDVTLSGDLTTSPGATGLVLFAHGSGSSRFSPRNRFVAGVLQRAGLATLLIDLLSPQEEAIDERTGHLRFDISLLARRLVAATDWLRREPATRSLATGYFGASTFCVTLPSSSRWMPRRPCDAMKTASQPCLDAVAMISFAGSAESIV